MARGGEGKRKRDGLAGAGKTSSGHNKFKFSDAPWPRDLSTVTQSFSKMKKIRRGRRGRKKERKKKAVPLLTRESNAIIIIIGGGGGGGAE